MNRAEETTGPRRDGVPRRLLVISHGSYEAAITGRNALFRFLDVSLDGYFSSIDYVFYRTGAPGRTRIAPGFTIHEVSGDSPASFAGAPWLRRSALLATGFAEIVGLARRVDPHVIVGGEPFIPGVIALSLARLLGRPLVMSLVSNYLLSYEAAGINPIPFLPGKASLAVEPFVLRNADRVMSDTEHYREYSIRRGARPERSRHVPRYVAPSFYEERPDPGIFERLGLRDSRPLVYVGRVAPEKYALDLVDALAVVRRRHPSATLLLIGDGPQLAEVHDKARGLGLAGAIEQRTGLSPTDIASAMGGAGALLVTHGGYALLEACLAGARVAAYDYEWHPEIIVPGETGWLAPYRDAAALGEFAARLLDDPAQAERFGAAAGEKAHRQYTRAMNQAAQVALFDELLGARRPH